MRHSECRSPELKMGEATFTIPDSLKDLLASTIASAGGNEVFFLGRVEWRPGRSAVLEEVEVVARGNRGAAPAILRRAEDWDLAIHNHPSGELSPSEADLSVAGELASREVGFAIIDNRAQRHYLVVPPFDRLEPERPLDPAEVEAIFAPGGPLSRELGDYETRPGQVAMAREVTEALNGDRVAAIEAGTGVGKSFAYLVPAILWSVRNKKRVVVSTNTINLQEQLIAKDLPFLERVLPVEFRYALIKGRGNYACKRKLAEAEEEAASRLLETDDEVRQLKELVAWARTTPVGSLAELSAQPPERVWEKVMSETDKSLKVNCRFYGECFYYQAKRAASRAQIVVVNHHLFFADLAVRRATGNYDWDLVIPGYQRVIFDEAHHLEDVASQHLGARFSQLGVRSRLSRLRSPKDPRKGTLPYLALCLRREGAAAAAEMLEQGLLQDLPRVAAKVEAHFQEVLALVEGEARRQGGAGGAEEPEGMERQLRLTAGAEQAPFREALTRRLREASEELSIILGEAEKAARRIEDSLRLPEERRASHLLELTSLRDRLKGLLQDMDFFLDLDESTHVRWVEVRGRRGDPERRGVSFATAPIRVADQLKEAVYDPVRSVVLTSATLAVEGNVSFLGDRLGFDRVAPERFVFSAHPSPFDFERQVLTLVPDDFPDPGSPGYEERIAGTVLSILRQTGGRAFILFTSYGLLRRTFQALETPLRAEGIRPLRQGDGGRSELLRRFRSGPPHALFGTDSFWEGVDVKGEALECVVITRLPFRVPSEPVQVARVEELRGRGGDPFSAFTVPQAVLKFKQGFGRLIRSATDRGAVVVLDRRIITKRYGQAFLRSLPPTRFVRGPTAKVVEALGEFFGGRRGADPAVPLVEPAPEAGHAG
jgi:ATP-dependent DNA helicase DinG